MGKPYTLSGANDQTIEQIDDMFKELYDTLATLTHPLLSATHSDTTPGTPIRGDLISAQGSGAVTWARLAIGAANRVLRSNGTDAAWGLVVVTTDISGVVPIANGGTNLSAYTQGDLLYASADNVLSRLAKNTTSHRYLSNSGTGVPSWATVDLSDGVTGTLLTTNGGTGVITYAIGDMLYYGGSVGTLTKMTIGLANTFIQSGGAGVGPSWSAYKLPGSVAVGDVLYGSSTSQVSGLADVAAGAYLRSGGVNTAPLWSSVTLPNAAAVGDIWYGSASGVMTALAKSASATRYLSNTGVSNIPAWAQIDLSNGVTGVLPYANFVNASAASVLVGRGSASGAGVMQEVTLGSGLTMTGTVLSSSGGGGSPGGSNTQVQFNDSAAFGGDAGLTFNKTTKALTLTGLLDISGASAGQIKFPATQNASSDAHTLDDYEEGTWTPTDGSGAGLTLVNADTHTGSPNGGYIKIGQMVYLAYQLQYPTTASAAQAKMDGIPFASENNTPPVYWGQTLVFTNSNGAMTSMNANVTWIGFYTLAPTPTAQTNVQMTGKYVYGNFQFRVQA